MSFNNNLESLPSAIAQLAQLQSLTARQLKSLPDSIWELTQLQELYVSENNLKSLPPEIGNLAATADSRCESQRADYAATPDGNLTQLQKLDVGHNNSTTLPGREIKKLTQMRSFNVSL